MNTQDQNKQLEEFLKARNMSPALAPYLDPKSADLGGFYYNETAHQLKPEQLSGLTPGKQYLRNLETNQIQQFNTSRDLENYMAGYLPNRPSFVQVNPDFSTGKDTTNYEKPPVYPVSGTPEAEAANLAASKQQSTPVTAPSISPVQTDLAQSSINIPQTETAVVPENLTRSKSGEYYKIGNDVYNSATDQKITLDEFKNKGLNFQFLPEGKYYKTGNDVYNPQGQKISLEQFQKLGLNFDMLPSKGEVLPERKGQSIEDFVKGIDATTKAGETKQGTAQGTTQTVTGQPTIKSAVQTSTSAREALGLPTAPIARDLFTAADQTSLTTARTERGTIQDELTTILDERMRLQAEYSKFSGEQVGLPEAGRQGVISEEGRKIQSQLDALNRRELVLETKLTNRNTVISELMKLQNQEYEDAVSQYNTKFSQAIQLQNFLNEQSSELKKNAMASWQVLANQYEKSNLTWDTLGPMRQQQIEELAIQAGFPGLSQYIGSVPEKAEIKNVTSRTDASGNAYFDILRVNADGSMKVESLFRGKGDGEGGGTKLSTEKKTSLLGAGFTQQEITQLESDIKKYGIDKATEGMPEKQKKSVLDVYGAEDTKQFLTKDYFKSFYTDEQLEKSAKDAGFTKGGILGAWTSADTESYLNSLEKMVEAYRLAGFTDKEILTKMQ